MLAALVSILVGLVAAWAPACRPFPTGACRVTFGVFMCPTRSRQLEAGDLLHRSQILLLQLARVHELRATEYVSAALIRKIGRTRFDSPTDKKLFTHDTWAQHAGLSPFNRWKTYVADWRSSSVLRAVLSRTAFVTAWAGVVVLLGSRLPMSPVALQLQGTAIGLVLAFRNNAAYERLAEARALMGKVITLGREIASGVILFLAPDEQDGYPTAEAYHLVRYMAVFGWVLKARLRDGEEAEDVLRAVLSDEEVGWLLKQRSPTVAIIGQIRKLLHTQYANGNLAAHLHSKLELNLFELYSVVGGIERLFTSPIPPTMTRHVVRSLCLWLLAMPLALIGSMPPLAVVFFTAATTYIFLGIEELGVQVEQPFDILPLWQICHLATRNVEEAAFAHHDPWSSSHRSVAELPPYDVQTFGHGPVWTSVPLTETAP